MSESPAPRSARRPTSRLRVLIGVYLALLAATIVALPLWLARVPDPDSMRSAPVPEACVVPDDYGPNATPPTRRSFDAPAPRESVAPAAPAASAPSTNDPVIERRWSQRDRVPAPDELDRQTTPPSAAAAPGGLDRSAEARRRRVRQFGGTRRTEDAVEAGLAWLAAHQEADGTWDRFEFGRRCPADDRCPGAAVRAEGYSFRAGLTGLSLLAFLGAGYTDRAGPYAHNVARAVDALLRAQMPHGGFDVDERMAGYNDALATFALAEYYAMTRDPRTAAPLARAVARLVLTQQELGGWDYLPRNDTGRNDTSITAWAVQALHACVAAGVHVPRRTLIKSALHFERAAEPDGRVRYSDAGIGFKIDETSLAPVYRYGPAMIAAGLTCEQLLGWRFDSPLVRRQQALLSQQFPSQALLTGRDPTQLHNYYYWYYGTVATFQAGGERWDRWNGSLRDAILPLQVRKSVAGRKPHAYGSWPPFGPRWGKWGRQGSRVYSTALGVLTLEIYYRHTPAYLEDHTVLTAGDWLAFIDEAGQRDRRQAVQVLQQMRVEVAEPVLVELLRQGDRSLARAAAVTLLTFDSPMGRPILERDRDVVPAWEREILSEALHRALEIEALPPARGVVRVFDAERRLATLDLPHTYLGMRLSAYRDGERVAELAVIKRFSTSSVVVAEVSGASDGGEPRPGDEVLSR